MRVIKIPYDISIPVSVHNLDVDLSSYSALQEMKQLIGIDMAEIVRIKFPIRYSNPLYDTCYIVDEVGKLKDGWEFRINYRASSFYPGSFYGDPIVGNVVVCARSWTSSFGECDLDDFPEDYLNNIMSLFEAYDHE